MFNQFTELFQTSLKPIEKLVELNISTTSTVAHQQGLLIASLLDNSISFRENMSATTDINHFVAEQSKFSADVQSQLTETMKQTSETLTKAQEDAAAIINESFSAFSAEVKVAPKAEVKVAPKAEVKVAPKAEVKAAPKAEVKVAPKAAPKAKVKAAYKK